MKGIDQDGRLTREALNQDLPEGDLSDLVLHGGPYMYQWAPTSGNAWRRSFLEAVLPVPEAEFNNYVDNYLSALSPLYGTHRSSEALSCWRGHGSNETATFRARASFDERLASWIARFDVCLRATAVHAANLGFPFDEKEWVANSWYHRLARAVAEVERLIPPTRAFALIDGDRWDTGGQIAGRTAIPITSRDGSYWGPPPDGGSLIAELESLRAADVGFIVMGWNGFWWLDHYQGFPRWLSMSSRELVATADVKIYTTGP
jgi:hypothetical protein